jgi:hypothetical protein
VTNRSPTVTCGRIGQRVSRMKVTIADGIAALPVVGEPDAIDFERRWVWACPVSDRSDFRRRAWFPRLRFDVEGAA